MKEISKYLIEWIQRDFLSNPENKNHWRSQIPEFSPSITNFLLDFYKKCEHAENHWNKEKQRFRMSPIDFSKGYNRGKYYDFIPEKLRGVIENRQKVGFHYEFSLYGQSVNISVVYPYTEDDHVELISMKKQKKYFEECIHHIYLWLSIVYPLKKPLCSQQLSIYLYLTDQTKTLSTLSSNEELLDEEHVNTAFTFACKRDNEIHVFREEEWMKVLIHETFHSLGLDFAYSDRLSQRSDSKIQQIFYPMPTSNDIRSYEIYCEMNAELWNLVLYSFFTKKNPESFLKSVRELLWYEKVFSVFQCVKVLHTMGLRYSDMYSSEPASMEKRKNYEERTYLFSYYVLKSICMTYTTEFMEWLMKQNGGSIAFLGTNRNIDQLVEFIREHYRDSVYLKNLEIMEDWFSSHRSNHLVENETLKMNVVEF